MRTRIMLPIFMALIGTFAGTARADLRPLTRVDLSTPAKREASRLSSEAASALIAGNFDQAVATANRAIAVLPSDPWPYYDKASALTELGKTNVAVATFLQAEARFSPAEVWGRSVAVYGRARALQIAGRCQESGLAFNEYQGVVRPFNAHMAQLAAAQTCTVRPVTIAQVTLPVQAPIATRMPRRHRAPLRTIAVAGPRGAARSMAAIHARRRGVAAAHCVCPAPAAAQTTQGK